MDIFFFHSNVYCKHFLTSDVIKQDSRGEDTRLLTIEKFAQTMSVLYYVEIPSQCFSLNPLACKISRVNFLRIISEIRDSTLLKSNILRGTTREVKLRGKTAADAFIAFLEFGKCRCSRGKSLLCCSTADGGESNDGLV